MLKIDGANACLRLGAYALTLDDLVDAVTRKRHEMLAKGFTNFIVQLLIDRRWPFSCIKALESLVRLFEAGWRSNTSNPRLCTWKR